MSSYTKEVERRLDGLEAVSPGACPGCDECGLGEVEDAEEDQDAVDAAQEGHFSWSQCECCGSSLGGDRYPAHGVIPAHSSKARKGERFWSPAMNDYIELHAEEAGAWPAKDTLTHMDVCVDCLMYLANGDEPEGWGG